MIRAKSRTLLSALRRGAGVGALLWLFSCTGFAFAQEVPVHETVLANGMKLLMVERHDDPSIAGGWVAHVGSSNERLGITGMAHLFEHMMFKGTRTIGTSNYERDLEILAAQDTVHDQMLQEEAKLRTAYRRGEISDLQNPTNQTPRMRELKRQFDDLIQQERQVLVKNEFDRIYTTAGASGMNAFTTEDMTGFFVIVPANKLELWMWMESERIFHPVFREFYAERDVVYEERRMRAESTPLGKFTEAFESLIWESSPYQWPVLGWPSDVASISKPEADAFFSTYYAPQNITLILVGDFQTAPAQTMAERYFNRIPPGSKQAPDVVTLEVKQPAEKRMPAEADTNPQVDIYWHTVPFQHKDSYPLDVLAQVLSTRTGRLYKGLVMGREVATEVYADQDSRKWAGLFNIGGEAREGHAPEEVETAIYNELDKLKNEDVPSHELQKVKNNFAAAEYRKLSSSFPILMDVLQNEGLGDWHEVNRAAPRIQAVTASDIKRVANLYFTRENRSVASYTRKKSDSPSHTPEEKEGGAQ